MIASSAAETVTIPRARTPADSTGPTCQAVISNCSRPRQRAADVPKPRSSMIDFVGNTDGLRAGWPVSPRAGQPRSRVDAPAL
jgi:hypothetical protein